MNSAFHRALAPLARASAFLCILALPRIGVALPLDLDGDTDRSGIVDGTREEDALESTAAVILLNNCDDDDDDGRPDNLDIRTNGEADKGDLEPIILRRSSQSVPGPVFLELRNAEGDQRPVTHKVRVLGENGREILGPVTSSRYYLNEHELQLLGTRDLRYWAEGLEFGARARLLVGRGAVPDDALELTVAPFLLTPHTLDLRAALVVQVPDGPRVEESTRYVDAVRKACDTADARLIVMQSRDPWIQDEMQWGYTETPRVTLPVVLRMHRLRPVGAIVSGLLGPDMGYFQPFDYAANANNSLNYGGNLEVTPATEAFPFGRVYYGSIPSAQERDYRYDRRAIDQRYQTFFHRQGVQPPIDFTSDWLAIGHVDQLFTFLPGEDGAFYVAIASPRLALQLLEQMGTDGQLHANYDESFNATTVGELLARRHSGKSIVDYNWDIDAKIFGADRGRPDPESIKGTLMRELDIADNRFIELPVLFHNGDTTYRERMHANALTPPLTNLSSLGQSCIMSDPMIPEFRAVVEDALEAIGQQVLWVDAWWLYHMNLGGVHCGMQDLRKGFARSWWTIRVP